MPQSIDAKVKQAPGPATLFFHHFPQLDGLRGLAIVLVMSGHWAQFSSSRFGGLGNSLAQLGLLLFFVLSRFLITGLLLKEGEQRGRLDLKAFYIRRLLRLGLALALFLSSCAILTGLRLLTDVPRYEFLVCLLYLRNIFGRSQSMGHLWSLSLEEQFYMLWPLTLKLVPSRRLLRVALITAASVAMLRTAGIMAHWFPYEGGHFICGLGSAYMRPWFRLDSILAGCCIALGLAGGDRPARILRELVSEVP